MRSSQKKINSILKSQLESLLCQAISDINSPKEAKEFIDGFFSPSEQEKFIKRLALAYWLKKQRPYSVIKENLKVSSATISMAQALLTKKGVQNALKKIEAEEWASRWSEKISKAWPLRIKKFVGK